MRTLQMNIEYDGSDFSGWQIQEKTRTIQGEITKALSVLFGTVTTPPIASGRTDAGTHALNQVAHLHTETTLPLDRIMRGLNGILPQDISILSVKEAPQDFHARYNAKRKRYRYRLRKGKIAVYRNYVWSIPQDLDTTAMNEASTIIIGKRLFGAFCKQDPIPKTLECEIFEARWEHQENEWVFEIEGNRFLRHMVRILVGTMVEIGLGKRSPQTISDLLVSGKRENAGRTAPAHGLHLLWVKY
ncbi:MAG: tRNA pseudouridine(38-40) synthase TruA [Candidatus Latescibacterota bacterium]|nr:tRNA pseudouridine(38-40) synthase TruA [Candidatus Latescibacterota bacterium]